MFSTLKMNFLAQTQLYLYFYLNIPYNIWLFQNLLISLHVA